MGFEPCLLCKLSGVKANKHDGLVVTAEAEGCWHPDRACRVKCNSGGQWHLIMAAYQDTLVRWDAQEEWSASQRWPQLCPSQNILWFILAAPPKTTKSVTKSLTAANLIENSAWFSAFCTGCTLPLQLHTSGGRCQLHIHERQQLLSNLVLMKQKQSAQVAGS